MHDWDEIRKTYGGLVFAASYRILKQYQLAADCAQDVFVDAHKRLQNRSVDNWPALLRWLAVHRALDQLRSEEAVSHRIEPAYEIQHLESRELNPSERAQFEELLTRVRREVATLPPRQAEAFWLHCIEQLSTSEVSRQMNIEDNATRVLIHRARVRLQSILADVNPTVSHD